MTIDLNLRHAILGMSKPSNTHTADVPNEHKSYYSATIFGTKETAPGLDPVVRQVESLFTDDIKTGNVPMNEWLRIPFFNDRQSPSYKLSLRVYPPSQS